VRPLRRLLAAAAALLAVFLLWLGFVWPPPSWWRTHWPARTAFMAMRERQLEAAGHAGAQVYDPAPVDSMSPWLARAVIAGEDQAFFSHHGIDYHALREAIGYRRGSFSWGNARDRSELARALGLAWERRDRLRGASTLTQQLAKNLYLSPSRNPLRKLKEAVISYRLEAALDKSRILELYLNVAELGPGLWGAAAASRHYFGVPPSRLSIAQAALLAATLPRPLTSNPSFRPGYALARQQLILLKLGGQPVVIPPADIEDTLPLPPVPLDGAILRSLNAPYDSAPPSRPDAAPQKDSAAVSPKPDTAAAPPARKPAPA
jgi:monofunctional biosynthetic peptidoglycan transglycosylase